MFKFVIICALLGLVSCGFGESRGGSAVLTDFVGTKIKMPRYKEYLLQGDTIAYDFDDADYKIVTLINASSCVPCEMKPSLWTEIINELKGACDVDVNFVMVLHAKDSERIREYLIREKFPHPFVVDGDELFYEYNDLPRSYACRTFMMNRDNEIMAMGNPMTNPDVRNLCRRLIEDGCGENYDIRSLSSLCKSNSRSFGVCRGGDVVSALFQLDNRYDNEVSVKLLLPSCDCTSACVDRDTIPPHGCALLEVKCLTDSMQGSFRQYVDVFIRESDVPTRLVIHGYIR